MNLGVIFLTGLTVGGLTCLAVQGGLLASVIASREEETTTNRKFHGVFATAVFLATKFLSYTLLGFLLGAFGGALNISNEVQAIMQLAAGLYMIAVACNLLNLHPIFRYAIIQPPRVFTRLIRNQSKSKDFFAPALLGGMTVFIPCGTTLAMEALAISSANAWTGGLILATFIAGTIPVFFGIGIITSLLGDTFRAKFLRIAAVAVIYLGVTSVNGSLVALGSPITLQSIGNVIASLSPGKSSSITQDNAMVTQHPIIDITSAGYAPNYIRVKKGEKVTLTLRSKDAYSCASAFRIPAMGISRNLGANDTAEITFIPTESGKFLFSCSMGMYQGVMEVL